MLWQMVALIRNEDFIKVHWGNERNVFTSKCDAAMWKEKGGVEDEEFNQHKKRDDMTKAK